MESSYRWRYRYRKHVADAFSQGANVTICGRTEERLTKSVESIRDEYQEAGKIQHLICDVTNEDQVYETIQKAHEFGGGLMGSLQMLVAEEQSSLPHATVEEFSRVLNLNVIGTMLL